MATLESLTRGAAVKGILPNGLVTISDVRWIGTVAIEVTYQDSMGRLGNELLYRDRESTLEMVETGRPWSFDGDGALFRPLCEANRIRLAYLFDPLLAVHPSLGYDIESAFPGTGLLRFIEVKGCVKGARTVTITKNEILTGPNTPGQFILAIVVIDQDATEVRYCRTPFQKEPDFKATSVNYDLDQLLAQSREPE